MHSGGKHMNSIAEPVTDQDDWPKLFRDIEDANARYDDAYRRDLRARVFDHPEDRDRATLDKWVAMGDRQQARTAIGQSVLGALRVAIQENPEQLRALLVESLGFDPDDARDAFAVLFARGKK